MNSAIAFFSFILIPASFAATKTYQVTGPVLDTSEDSITVQKGSEKWEIAKDSNTKALAGYAKGDKVTISYTMTAKQIEPRTDGKSDAKTDAKKKK